MITVKDKTIEEILEIFEEANNSIKINFDYIGELRFKVLDFDLYSKYSEEENPFLFTKKLFYYQLSNLNFNNYEEKDFEIYINEKFLNFFALSYCNQENSLPNIKTITLDKFRKIIINYFEKTTKIISKQFSNQINKILKERYINQTIVNNEESKYIKTIKYLFVSSNWIFSKFFIEKFDYVYFFKKYSYIYDYLNKEIDKEIFISYYIIDFFTKNNYEIINELEIKWSKEKLLKENFEILRDCLRLFKKENELKEINIHNLIIPTLINQIESIKKQKILKKFKYTNKNVNLNGKEHSWETFYKKLSSNHELLNYTSNYMTNLFNGKEKVNRHSISHGESYDYGKKEFSIKLIILIDYLSDLKIEY